MPLPLYLQNEASIATQTPGLAPDVTSTEAFRLLKEDPEARLIVSCKLCEGAAGCAVLMIFSSWGNTPPAS